MNTANTVQKPHQGKNIKRLREILGIKQETLADKLHTTQQNISLIESKEIVEEDILKKVADIFNVPMEVIKDFSDEGIVNIVSNTFNDTFNENSAFFNFRPNFNPIEKIVELYKEKEELYQKMLDAEKEKIEFLKKLLDK